MNSLISVIVPVYNTAAYLDRCVKSIAEQTFKNLEIILVNDGSTDSSGTLCDSWKNKDSRVCVIHKGNGGVTTARKTGVENASGEWVCFVDSDDELPENSIYTLFMHTRYDIDIVYGMYKYTGKWKPPYSSYNLEQNTLQYMKFLLKKKIHHGLWARLMRKKLFDDFVFDIPAQITNGEDFMMNLRLGQKVRRVILLSDIVYHYISRTGSAATNNPMLNKNYRIAYENVFNQSMHEEYRKALSMAIIWRKTLIIWWLLKDIVKKKLFRSKL